MDLRLHNFEEGMVDILGNEIIFETWKGWASECQKCILKFYGLMALSISNFSRMYTYMPKLKWVAHKIIQNEPLLNIVFCCIVAWIKPESSGFQQDFSVVWKWNFLFCFWWQFFSIYARWKIWGNFWNE